MRGAKSLGARDYVALVLAASAGASVIALTVAAVINGLAQEGDISTAYASLLTGTLGVLIGALSGYIGGRHNGTDADEPPVPPVRGPVRDPAAPPSKHAAPSSESKGRTV